MARYMKTNKINITGLFNKLDSDKNGLLSKNEMRVLFIEEFQMDIDEEEFNNFFDSFDIDRSENINI